MIKKIMVVVCLVCAAVLLQGMNQERPAKQKITNEMEKAERELQKEIPSVGTTITAQLLGKDLSR